ncbi:hypothetical protein [Saccharopolyspora hattusasensis]|uniref:hypothetical protein n=1 Tax=Saccharopolyspora hattusasensis TaxID=1128679 RepID=UPI003D99C503
MHAAEAAFGRFEHAGQWSGSVFVQGQLMNDLSHVNEGLSVAAHGISNACHHILDQSLRQIAGSRDHCQAAESIVHQTKTGNRVCFPGTVTGISGTIQDGESTVGRQFRSIACAMSTLRFPGRDESFSVGGSANATRSSVSTSKPAPAGQDLRRTRSTHEARRV